jgi:hypothetical protein
VRDRQHPQPIGLHFVVEIKAESLTMIEESGGTEFLIGERVVADPRHRS